MNSIGRLQIALRLARKLPKKGEAVVFRKGSFEPEAAKFKRKKQVPSEDGGKTTVYEYSERQVALRNREKAKQVEKLRKSIADLREQYKKDLGKKPEALVVALMDVTYERVGNEESASAGHYGVTGWKVKHVSFSGSKATIKYTGKSGVKHTKTVEDAAVVSALKKAVKGKSPDDTVCEATAEDANAYLKPFDVSAKDLRGLHANQEMLDRLKTIRSKGGELPSDPKKRKEKLKAEFDKALEEAAGAVGHESSTLRSQYLVPGLEDDYVKDGTIQTKLASSAGPTKLVMFDFDGTLFRSDEKPPPWWNVPGTYSWGMNPISLSPPCVPKNPPAGYWNSQAVSAAKEAQSDPNTILVIVTGRVKALKPRVHELLKQKGINPATMHFNPGLGATSFKRAVLGTIIGHIETIDHVTIWENENLTTYMKAVESMAENFGRDIIVEGYPVHMREVPVDCGPEILSASVKTAEDVMDPRTNFRGIVKQLLLLEDHLAHEDRRCDDCINKHLMTAEALAEEAVTLDGGATYHEICEIVATVCRELQDHYRQGIDPLGLVQTSRTLRKDVFSRSVAARVAALAS